MSNILFANNASTVLAAPISSGATSCTVTTGTGALFPNPSGGQYFCMTFVDAATGLVTEIVHVTARSGDTLTIQRAQEGTTAHSWLAGDIAANFWTAGSVTALEAGFPTGSSTYSSSTTLSITDAGNLLRIGGTGTVITLPSASTVSGMAVGLSGVAAFTLSIVGAGGVFAGGAANGQTSISVAATQFVCVQSNGTSWVIFSASPEILEGGTIALQSWVTANFDALGAAAAAQTNAENFATALQGNYPGTRSVTASTTFTSADFGYVLRLGQSAVGNSAFTLPAPVVGTSYWIENVSTFILTVTCGTANQFYGLRSNAYVAPSAAQTSFTLTGPGSALIVGTPGGWAVVYKSQSFDLFGSAATAQTVAEAYTDNAIATSGYSQHSHIYASSGTFTYTIPTGITAIFGQVCGAGGAGGGSASGNPGGCGGGGGYAEGWITGLTPGNTISITVGAGGVGVSGTNGGNGGTSSIGAFMSATGGNGAVGGSAVGSPGGQGGLGSGGEVNLWGGYGSDGTVGDGLGGASYFGGGSRAFNNTPLAAQMAPGGGGGGSYNTATRAGANGRDGIVILRW